MITSPLQISNCVVWLDASDTTTLFQLSGGTTAVAANNDPVGYWGDKSGNNRHFTNVGGSTTTRPIWIAALSTVRFDGSNDWLQSFFNITYTAQTVFLAIKYNVHSTDARIYSQTSSANTSDAANTTNQYVPVNFSNAAQYAARIRVNLNESQGAGVSPRASGIFDVFSAVNSGTTIRHFLNGVSGSTLSHSVTASLNIPVVQTRLANNTSGTSPFFNGDISEVIVYNKALTNAEREDVEYYLTRKWSVLNSIPRQVYAIQSGNWSDSAIWSTGLDPAPWTFPLSSDNVYSNTFTVTADSSTRVVSLRNDSTTPNIASGGRFVLTNNISLTGNVIGSFDHCLACTTPGITATLTGTTMNYPSLSCIGSNNTVIIINNYTIRNGSDIGTSLNTIDVVGANLLLNNCTLPSGGVSGAVNWWNVRYGGIAGQTNYLSATNCVIGNTSGGNQAPVIWLSGMSPIAYFRQCNIRSSGGGSGSNGGGIVYASTNGVLEISNSNIFGLIGSGFPNPSVWTNSTTTTNIVSSNIYAGQHTSWGTNYAISNAGVCNLYECRLFSNTATTIFNTGTLLLCSCGDLLCHSFVNHIISSSTVPLSIVLGGNIINAPNGRQAIYAYRYQNFPTNYSQYTRQAVNGYGSYVDYWTSNSTFNYPASSDVALGTVYSNGSLVGSMVVPSPSSVVFGAPVGITVGTALPITTNDIFNIPSANLTAPNSIGARLKNITTTQALTAIVNSLNLAN